MKSAKKREQSPLPTPTHAFNRVTGARVPLDGAQALREKQMAARAALLIALDKLQSTRGSWIRGEQMLGEALAITTGDSRCWISQSDLKTVVTSCEAMKLEFSSSADARAWLDAMISE